MKIMVLDGNENQAVACVRSLSQAGHEVYVGAPTPWSKAGWSRFSRGQFQYIPPEMDALGYVRDIVGEIRSLGTPLVLPLTERGLLLLSERREEVLAAGGLMVLAPHATVLRAFDKQATTELAKSLGIPTPWTALVRNVEECKHMSANLAYPVVLKPRSSQHSSAGRLRSTGRPTYARDERQFIAASSEMLSRSPEFLVQEFVEGTGEGYFALLHKGQVRFEFAHRRLRDVNPTGSGSSLRISVRPAARMKEMATALLEAMGWHGVAMVEFRVRPDGNPVFLEVNGRFWTSLALAVYAGIDFPARLAEMAQNGNVAGSREYREGVRCRWLLGDFRHLLAVWGGAPSNFPGKFPARWATLGQFLRPVRGTFHDNFRLDDPLPELGDWLDFFLRRVPLFLRRRKRSNY
jgi:predicted ATP-grasp superfamily ATP-dependent carboligase